jgi:hypothetical protein
VTDFDEDTFFKDLEASVADDSKLAELSTILTKRKEIMERLAVVDDEAKILRSDLLRIETMEIPDKMDEAGMSEFTTKDGYKVSIKPFVSAIPAGSKEQAYNWLEDNGLGSIIKRRLNLQFEKAQSEVALLAEAKLKEMGFDPKMDMDVNYQTFQATVKDLHSQGIMPPLHEWGVYFGRKAVVKVK